jgi:hypothetical protein
MFLVTLAMAIRTFTIGTNDIYFFGRGDRWHCETVVNVFHVSVLLEIYAPGYAPIVVSGTGPFSYHAVANGGTWAISPATTRPTYISRDWYFLGNSRGTVAGSVTERAYWLWLPFVPFAILLISAGALGHWGYAVYAHRRAVRQGFCPSCRYDLRAHQPGQKCPECGAVIVAKGDLR